MKKLFKSLLVGGLSIAAASALFVGVGSAKETVEVDAATSTTIYYVVEDSVIGDGNSVRLNFRYGGYNSDPWGQANLEKTGKTYHSIPIYSATFTDMYDGLGVLQFQKMVGTSASDLDVAINYKWTTQDVYNGKMWVHGEQGWKTYYDDTMASYTVHGYIVLDGVKQSTDILGDEVGAGTFYDVPSNPTLDNLQHFGGWFLNQSCDDDQEFEGQTVNNDLTIFAKVTTMSLDSYFYWIDKDSSDLTGGSVYFFGEYTNDWNNGLALSSCKVSDVLMLEGQGKLYKIPVPSIGNYQVILHNGNVQTLDMTITQHAVIYTWFKDTGDNGISYYNYSADVNEGLAADLLVDVETVRTNVPAAGEIGSMSLCGVSASEAARLYGIYEGFTGELAGVKTMVDNSYTYTYNPNAKNDLDPTHEQNVTFDKIMEQLYEIAMKDATFAAEHPASNRIISMFGNDSNINASVLIIIICASVLVVGATFVLRRKEN